MKTLIRTNPVVATRPGQVRGTVIDGVNVFKGIPYAAPPFGANRLRRPRPVTPWTGVRDATVFGPKSPQPVYPPMVRLLLPELTGSGEDCLTLNVWAPETGTGHPVMVWIPGGMFEYHGMGACPWYEGSRFARDGVVCVTINYRVGAEGFLFLEDGDANLGLLDQVAALRWVRDNIEQFGGDPDNVTIFGESAGAMSVGTLLAMPCAEGLFRRAIVESGGAQQVVTPADALRVGRHLAEKLGVEPKRDAIAAVPVERFLQAQEGVREDLMARPDPGLWGREAVLSGLPWQPVVDGSVLPSRPLDRVAAGASAKVDLMTGSNLEENRLFLVPENLIDGITPEALNAAVGGYGLLVDTALATYRAARPGASAGDLLAAVQSDWLFRIPAVRLADAHTKSPGATYMYEFAWRSQQFDGRLGACHALEIPFVFDSLGCGTESLCGPNPPQELADKVHSAWVSFAKTGDPGWPKYDTERRTTMRFDVRSSVVDDPRAAERALWEGVR